MPNSSIILFLYSLYPTSIQTIIGLPYLAVIFCTVFSSRTGIVYFIPARIKIAASIFGSCNGPARVVSRVFTNPSFSMEYHKSTGLVGNMLSGKTALSFSMVCAESSGISRPCSAQMSETTTPTLPAAVTMATRFPLGTGWVENTLAKSLISVKSSALMQPV